MKIMKRIINTIKSMFNNFMNGGVTMLTPSGMIPVNFA